MYKIPSILVMKIKNNFNDINFNSINLNNISFFLIDGITGSGKTTFTNIFKTQFKKNCKVRIISKDLFLKTRQERIEITKKNKNKKNINQNTLQYDFKKYSKLIKKFKYEDNKVIILDKLYNRKNGKNNLKMKFKFDKNVIYLIEGIYVIKDFDFLPKNKTKIIFLETDIYLALAEKLRRIRDKKISLSLVVKEFVNIHLYSYANYIEKTKFDYFINRKGKISKFKKNMLKIVKLKINQFLKKHL